MLTILTAKNPITGDKHTFEDHRHRAEAPAFDVMCWILYRVCAVDQIPCPYSAMGLPHRHEKTDIFDCDIYSSVWEIPPTPRPDVMDREK